MTDTKQISKSIMKIIQRGVCFMGVIISTLNYNKCTISKKKINLDSEIQYNSATNLKLKQSLFTKKF